MADILGTVEFQSPLPLSKDRKSVLENSDVTVVEMNATRLKIDDMCHKFRHFGSLDESARAKSSCSSEIGTKNTNEMK